MKCGCFQRSILSMKGKISSTACIRWAMDGGDWGSGGALWF